VHIWNRELVLFAYEWKFISIWKAVSQASHWKKGVKVFLSGSSLRKKVSFSQELFCLCLHLILLHNISPFLLFCKVHRITMVWLCLTVFLLKESLVQVGQGEKSCYGHPYCMELRKNDTGGKEYCERRRQGKDCIVLFIIVIIVCCCYCLFVLSFVCCFSFWIPATG